MSPRQQLERDLASQHAALLRAGYDGHNRRSGLLGMRQLGRRRSRRSGNRNLRALTARWV